MPTYSLRSTLAALTIITVAVNNNEGTARDISAVSRVKAMDVQFEIAEKHYRAANLQAAVKIWFSLAEAGHGRSQSAIGRLYFHGFRRGREEDQSFYWLSKAANGGEPRAQHYLGRLYLMGRGVTPDTVQAYKWCALALLSGQTLAENCKALAKSQLPDEGVKKAEEEMVSWFSHSQK